MTWARTVRVLVLSAGVAGLVACGGPPKPQPKPLAPLKPQLSDRKVWSVQVGKMGPDLKAAILPQAIVVAASGGRLQALDPSNGRRIWAADAQAALSAGVGSDGRYSAVVTVDNELQVFDRDRRAWKIPLNTRVVTAPLVAGERVFILGVDRSVSAYDVIDGRRIWMAQRPGDPLTLAQPGVLLPVQNQLLAGVGAKLVVLDAMSGAVRQEWTMATPRGANEVERLADLVGPAVKAGESLCVHAYQAAVGCVNLRTGQMGWTQPFGGYHGLATVHADLGIVASDASDRISSWRVSDGQSLWSSEALMHRGLGAPGASDRAIVVGDREGRLHYLSPSDGQFLLRLTTDGSPITAAPQRSGKHLIVTTQDGGVFAFGAD